MPAAQSWVQEVNNLLAQPPTTTEPSADNVIRTSSSQLFCCKSIDKLISEAEDPARRLKKTLGPWSLTALGIGAIIGSGIFVLTGTAAAGEYFQAPSILHAQVLDLIVNLLRGGGTAQVLMHVHLPDKWSTPVWETGHWTGSYFNLPAFVIIFILTVLLVRGVRESAEANNVMVAIKIGAILIFLVVGGALVNPSNWHPFAPSGFGGVVTGGAIVFFTYIGFDSVSTAAEEARNPQRDLPIGIIGSLIVCTILYVGVSIVLLGMMKYTTFVSGEAAQAPVAYALQVLGASRWSRSIIVIGALTGMISSLLVFQYGQARIWYAMSRDRLFPKLFSKVHAKFKTPHYSTWIAGFAVGIPAGIFAISDAADLSNIGTLFAFVLVSLGVIILRRTQPDRKRVFKVPFVPWFPLVSIVLCGGLMTGLTVITWLRFVIWLGLGLLIYIFYSRHRSEFGKR